MVRGLNSLAKRKKSLPFRNGGNRRSGLCRRNDEGSFKTEGRTIQGQWPDGRCAAGNQFVVRDFHKPSSSGPLVCKAAQSRGSRHAQIRFESTLVERHQQDHITGQKPKM